MRTAACIIALGLSAWNLRAAQIGQETPNQALISEQHTNAFKWAPLVPGKDDSRIARVTAAFLERGHYLQQPIDATISSNFYTRYVDSLDPMHIMFLQSDIAEFDKWKLTLGEMALKIGDTAPATIIYNRFMQRLRDQVKYVTNAIATEKFEFTTDERYTPNRRELPRPKDLAEARTLWRERVRYEWLNELLNKEKPAKIKEDLLKRYNRQFDMLERWDSDDVLQIYLDALAHAYDPHSDYMGKPASDNFNIGMRLSLFGIGALLRSEDGYCKIEELKDGPAKKSGQLKPNDKIIAVAQGTNAPVDVIDWKLNKVVELIRGDKGTEVRLTVIPVDAPDNSVRKVVSIIRDEIKLEDQEAKARLLDLPAENGQPATRLGVISLPSFYADLKNRGPNRKSTTTDVAKLLKKLKEEKVSGVILDLRYNGGGSLEEAINLTGLFIKEGPVVQVKDSDGHITVDKDTDPDVLYDGPLVVMTSRFSASASEIVAGALQDYGRALLVGDSSTHGKGTVQTLLDVGPLLRTKEELGSLKITIRKFYRASGSSTQRRGVIPDIVLPSVNNLMEVGEDSMPNALPWDTIPSAKYEPVNMVPPALAGLRQRSEARTAKDADFAFIQQEIERYKKLKDEKSVSMNEALRWKEKQEVEERDKARKKELRARPLPNYKTYELTLKNADLPGLPEPMTNAVSGTLKSITWNSEGIKKVQSGAAQLVTNNLTFHTTNLLGKVTGTNGVGGTNTLTTVKSEDDAPVPNVDPTLDETRRILRDLIAATGKTRNGLAVRP